MTPEQAKALAEFLLADAERERATTRKVIAAVPAGQESYSPDAKSMNALKLAWHIASSDWWFLTSIVAGQFASGDEGMPENIKTVADVLAWMDANVPPAHTQAAAMGGQKLAATLDFFGMFQAPAVEFLNLNLKHIIHHRGQLSAYLRPMGGKVPGIYGPSGDEPISK
jgi:uncharacterized damage-inducible protein DinB